MDDDPREQSHNQDAFGATSFVWLHEFILWINIGSQQQAGNLDGIRHTFADMES